VLTADERFISFILSFILSARRSTHRIANFQKRVDGEALCSSHPFGELPRPSEIGS